MLALLVILGVVGYAILAEVAFSAGRIHPGVEVGGVDVGGLTPEEATERLDERGEQLRVEPVEFAAGELVCRFYPYDVGWQPQPARTAQAAREVGRAHAPFGALVDRARAWLDGVRVPWAGIPKRRKVGDVMDVCEARAAELGLTIDRRRFRSKIRRALTRWDRKVFRIPLANG